MLTLVRAFIIFSIIIAAGWARAEQYLFPSDTLPAGRSSVSVLWERAESSGNAVRTDPLVRSKAVDRQSLVTMKVAHGITDSLEITATLPYYLDEKETFSGATRNDRTGDYRLEGRFAIKPGWLVAGFGAMPGGTDRKSSEIEQYLSFGAPRTYEYRSYLMTRARLRGGGQSDSYGLQFGVESRFKKQLFLDFGADWNINVRGERSDNYLDATTYLKGRLEIFDNLYLLSTVAISYATKRTRHDIQMVSEGTGGYRVAFGLYWTF